MGIGMAMSTVEAGGKGGGVAHQSDHLLSNANPLSTVGDTDDISTIHKR